MCISSVSFSVLVNGSPSSFFSSSKGLKQGDPLSSLLLILIMEVLSSIIDKAVEQGMMTGFKIEGRNGDALTVSHFLFANDTIIFCEVDWEQLVNLKFILYFFFELFMGLIVNFNKSEIMPVGIVPNVEALAKFLSCKISSFPATFLGLPLGSFFKA